MSGGEHISYEAERDALIVERRDIEAALSSMPKGSRENILGELRRRRVPSTSADVDQAVAMRQKFSERQRAIDGRLSELKSLVKAEREASATGRHAFRHDGTVDYGVVGLMLYGELVAIREALERISPPPVSV